jgi:hypothetical protein
MCPRAEPKSREFNAAERHHHCTSASSSRLVWSNRTIEVIMSVPGNINTAPPPSSFDDDVEFYQESRWGKLKRRLKEEPLIPLGCALTCWALYEA